MPKQKQPIRTAYTDHLYDKEDLRSYMLPLYITRIDKVRFIDTDKIVKINLTAKNVYGFFCGLGYNKGYHSIYPSLEFISECLCLNEKTVRNAIKTLEEAKLIKARRIKQQGRFDKTHYWIYRPNMVDRVQWLNVNGDILKGSHYNFDYRQFTKSINKDNDKRDRLLEGLLTNQENKDNMDYRG